MEVETSLSSSVSMRHVDLGPLNLFGRVPSDGSEEATDFSDSSSTSEASFGDCMAASTVDELLAAGAFCHVDSPPGPG